MSPMVRKQSYAPIFRARLAKCSEKVADLSFPGAWDLHLLPVLSYGSTRYENIVSTEQLPDLVIRVGPTLAFILNQLLYL